MDRIGAGLRGPALAVVLAGVGSCSLSSTEFPGASGTGGTIVLTGPGGTSGGAGSMFGDTVRLGRGQRRRRGADPSGLNDFVIGLIRPFVCTS
jgi:hypothetical protein